MDWSCMDYCYYYFDVFISCLDSHSDGTHSLQRIHWWSDVMLDSSKSVLMKKQTDLQSMFIFDWTIPLMQFIIMNGLVIMKLKQFVKLECKIDFCVLIFSSMINTSASKPTFYYMIY